MKAVISLILTLFALQVLATPTPEEMYGDYDKDGKYRAMQVHLFLMKLMLVFQDVPPRQFQRSLGLLHLIIRLFVSHIFLRLQLWLTLISLSRRV